MSTVFVSVVVPTRNRAALLEVTLRSILAQEAVELEVIVVDDASTDRTPQLLASLKSEGVVSIRPSRNLGMAGARNAGIAAAQAEWISFCDDDDVWAPSKLRRQLAAIASGGCSWAFTGAVHVDENLSPLKVWPRLGARETVVALRTQSAVPAGASNVLVKAEVLRHCGGFFEGLRHASDWDLWVRLAQQGLPAVVDAPLLGYRRHPGNDSRNISSLAAEIPLLRQRTGIAPASYWRWLAERAIEQRKWRAGLPLLARAMLRTRDVARLRRDVRGLAWHLRAAVLGERWERRQTTDPWLAEAEQWLAPLRSTT